MVSQYVRLDDAMRDVERTVGLIGLIVLATVAGLIFASVGGAGAVVAVVFLGALVLFAVTTIGRRWS